MNARIALVLGLVSSIALALPACDGDSEEGTTDLEAKNFGHGAWEVSLTTVTEGIEIGPVMIRTCVSLENPAPGFKLAPPQVKCDATSRLSGLKLSWQQACKFENHLWETGGAVTYDAAHQTFQGELINKEDGRTFSTGKLTGRRIGDC